MAERASAKIPPQTVVLRRTVLADVPMLFQFQLDSEGNRLAGTKPRDRAAFDARWAEIFREAPDGPTSVIPRVILADGVLVGSINVLKQDNADWLGYWLDREHWGRGIVSRAIRAMTAEVSTRPLFARVVVHNVASLRALERNGFVVASAQRTEETDRFTAAERVVLRLDNVVEGATV